MLKPKGAPAGWSLAFKRKRHVYSCSVYGGGRTVQVVYLGEGGEALVYVVGANKYTGSTNGNLSTAENVVGSHGTPL